MLKYIWLENEMKVTASDGTVVWTAYDYGKYRCSWEIHYNNRSSNTKYNMTQNKSESEITYYTEYLTVNKHTLIWLPSINAINHNQINELR